MQMFHAYFTRAYRYAPQHFRHVGTSGMSTHKQRHSACSLFGGPFHARAGPLFRTWPLSSARKPAIPSLGNPAHVRNRRPTCETAGSHAGHVGTQVTVAHSQSMTDHGAATHRPAMQHSQERGKHHHLQQRLSRAAQPTSHHPSNTICPASKLASTN